jgi:hypothetical protein
MSHKINDEVLSQLETAFDEAKEEGNIELCRKIIAEVKDLDVFSAKVLETEMLDAPLSNFSKPSYEF